MHRFYSLGLEKWYKPMIWLDKNQNHLLWCQNGVVISFVEMVNQGESLASWLNWLTEPPAVCWSVIMGDLSASWKGVYWTLPKAFRTGPPSCVVHSMVTRRRGSWPPPVSTDEIRSAVMWREKPIADLPHWFGNEICIAYKIYQTYFIGFMSGFLVGRLMPEYPVCPAGVVRHLQSGHAGEGYSLDL